MNIVKFLAKVGALVATIVALLLFANQKDDNKYVLVYEDTNV